MCFAQFFQEETVISMIIGMDTVGSAALAISAAAQPRFKVLGLLFKTR
jgi:hypothetical protein